MSITAFPPLGQQVETEQHWTEEEFYQAAAEGRFVDPDRLELIHGRLVRLMQGQRHSNLRVRVSRQLRKKLDPPLFVRDENPLHVAFDGEPIPDLMLTYEEEYLGRHPELEDVALLVEVADSSVESDLGEKASLYAQSGISDYWVVLVNEDAAVVHREPSGKGYQSVAQLSGADTLSPLAMPDITWTTAGLLGNKLLGRSEAR